MSDDTASDGGSDTEDAFATELARARDLLDGEGIEALHVGVVRDGEIDTTFAQRTGGDPENEGLRALALLSAHVRTVANEAGVDAATVAGDAATLAGRVEQIPADTDDLPDE
jgi:predicted Abi (CAAX) family protease